MKLLVEINLVKVIGPPKKPEDVFNALGELIRKRRGFEVETSGYYIHSMELKEAE